jgi:hypothetical protein
MKKSYFGEKIVVHLFKKLRRFREPERPATNSYPEPDESRTHLHILFILR